MPKGDVEHLRTLGGREGKLTDHSLHDAVGIVGRQGWDAGIVKHVANEIAVLLRKQALGIELAVAEVLVACGVKDVDAVGLAADVVINPR